MVWASFICVADHYTTELGNWVACAAFIGLTPAPQRPGHGGRSGHLPGRTRTSSWAGSSSREETIAPGACRPLGQVTWDRTFVGLVYYMASGAQSAAGAIRPFAITCCAMPSSACRRRGLLPRLRTGRCGTPSGSLKLPWRHRRTLEDLRPLCPVPLRKKSRTT